MIAYFVYNLNNYSGAAQQALLLAKYLNKKILIFNHNNSDKVKNYKYNDIIEIVDLPSNKLLQIYAILHYTLKYDINIYHFHGFFKLGLIIGNILGRKIILKTTLLGDDDFDTILSRNKYLVFFVKKIYKNIVLSLKLKAINSKYLDNSKIEIIPNGVELPETVPTLERKDNLFVFVGLVCDRKRTYESIKYFIDNYSANPINKMYIVGPYRREEINNNKEFDENYVEKCKKLIKDSSLESRIKFLGKLSKIETQEILKKSKALIFFSKNEGMPNVVLEALANNCVPITTDINGVAEEIFENKKEGFILSNELSEKIPLKLIDDLIINKKPYLRAKNSFDIKKIADKYDMLYNKDFLL
jgi:glycosyltransferase involved in cell wall biosynthesis